MRNGFATTGDLDGLPAFHAREHPFQVLLELAHRYRCPSHARHYVLQIAVHHIPNTHALIIGPRAGETWREQ